jgi:O-antigen ligase
MVSQPLIDVALFERMSNHWLTGYGYNVDPGWGPRLDGRPFTDTVNHYILELHRFGLAGLLPFLALNIEAVRRLRKAYAASAVAADQWLVWCVSGALSGLWAAMMSVSLFGPPTTVFFMLLAFAGLLPDALGEPAAVRANAARVRGPNGAGAAKPSVSY